LDTATLVEPQIDDGRKLIEQLTRDGFDVTAAFWVRFGFNDYEPFFFYVVSKAVDAWGLPAAYRAVHASIQRIPAPWGPWITLSELKLVGPNDPLAKKVLTIRDLYPGSSVIPGRSLGDMSIQEAYVYPLPRS